MNISSFKIPSKPDPTQVDFKDPVAAANFQQQMNDYQLATNMLLNIVKQEGEMASNTMKTINEAQENHIRNLA
ncbi:MAG TPA: hypothetical protein VF666_10470 [Pyrinomonadaceae bacterium]|jgi:hypothetical protein